MTYKNCLIFGINSQDGFYLQQVCAENHINCIGVSRSIGNWLVGNVTDFELVKNLVQQHKPTYIFHIAANSTTNHQSLFEQHHTISTGTLNILECVQQFSPNTKVFITGSGVQFTNKGFPIRETDEFEASSPYAIARIQSVYAARYYRKLGIKTYVGYLFHHDSSLRKENHISKKITEAVIRIQKGNKEIIELGDISVMKEWAFAGDIAKGILALIQQDNIFEATIGTGLAYPIQDWLEICFSNIGLDWQKYTVFKQNFTAEYKLLVSDPATIFSIGWNPTVDVKTLADKMINLQL